MKPNNTIHLIYDGQCRFCIRSLKIFRALDLKHSLRFYDAHNTALMEEQFPELAQADCDNAMFAVTEERQVFRGFFAFRRIVWSSPLTWVLIPLFYFPGASWLGCRVYAWVARNRLKFGCRSEACALSSPLEEQPFKE